MRLARLFAALLATLTTLLLAAPGAAAEPPLRLPETVTDHAGVLSASGQADVQHAVDKLYNDRRIRLWVVYVEGFSGQTADSWGRATAGLNELGSHDALLAVATADRGYSFLVSKGLDNIDSEQVEDVRRNNIEPALHRGDWSGAAVAAATGLDKAAGPAEVSLAPMLIALGAVVLAGVLLWLVMRYRRDRRRRAQLAAARRLDPTDADALATAPLYALNDLSRSMVIGVDNAVRTSANELALALEEFGEQRTQPFAQAVDNAKAALTKAFDVRQQLDDAIPETREQRRELLTGVIVSAAKADRELEAQREAFEQLRDLVLNAPSRLDALTQQLVELTARLPVSERHLGELHREFAPAALTSVSGNVKTTKDRVAFADRNITRARDLAGRPAAGGQGELVDAVRAAESALGQGRALLDAVDSAAGDIRHAVETLPSTVTDVEAGIAQAKTQLEKGGSSHTRELTAARNAAVKAVAAARGSTDPLGAFTQLTNADAELDRLLDTVAEEQQATERLKRTLEQALFSAQSRVRAASDYIDTRRGSVGSEARTRLAEARRQLQAAQDARSTNLKQAIAHANTAAALAAKAQSLANSDVQSAQRAYYGRRGVGGGNDTGAMLGGIIIGNVLGGGFGGGSGGWSPTSFGGSDSGGGGFFGGGGRF
jgi:uncharacterized membrane protein YgcG